MKDADEGNGERKRIGLSGTLFGSEHQPSSLFGRSPITHEPLCSLFSPQPARKPTAADTHAKQQPPTQQQQQQQRPSESVSTAPLDIFIDEYRGQAAADPHVLSCSYLSEDSCLKIFGRSVSSSHVVAWRFNGGDVCIVTHVRPLGKGRSQKNIKYKQVDVPGCRVCFDRHQWEVWRNAVGPPVPECLCPTSGPVPILGAVILRWISRDSSVPYSKDQRAFLRLCIQKRLRTQYLGIGTVVNFVLPDGSKEFFVVTKLSRRDEGSPFTAGPVQVPLKDSYIVEIIWDDDVGRSASVGLNRIGGMPEVVSMVERMVIYPILHPEHFAGGEEDIALSSLIDQGITRAMIHTATSELPSFPVKGIILYGVPGTGKTYICQSIREELELNFQGYNQANSSLNSWRPAPWVHVLEGSRFSDPSSVNLLTQVFTKARQLYKFMHQFTVLFIDEIDVITSAKTDALVKGVLHDCLVGQNSHPGTLVIGTTNRIDAVDTVFRDILGYHVEMPIPGVSERRAIMSRLLLKYHLVESESQALDLTDGLVDRAHGFVPADLDAWAIRSSQQLRRRCIARLTPLKEGKLSREDLELALRNSAPSALKEHALEHLPEVRWDDIGGYEDVKDHLKELVLWIPTGGNPSISESLKIRPPSGILLYGPPGTSKTMLAKALATESRMNFIAVKGPEIFSKWVGESEKAIRAVFRKARQFGPTVLFFDEVDSIGSRSSDDGASIENKVISEFIREIDECAGSRLVILVGATNHLRMMDENLLAPGRFDRHVYVGLPEPKARREIFRIYLEGVANMDDDDFHDQLMCLSDGLSGAEIAGVCNDVKMLSIKYKAEGLPFSFNDHIVKNLRATRRTNDEGRI